MIKPGKSWSLLYFSGEKCISIPRKKQLELVITHIMGHFEALCFCTVLCMHMAMTAHAVPLSCPTSLPGIDAGPRRVMVMGKRWTNSEINVGRCARGLPYLMRLRGGDNPARPECPATTEQSGMHADDEAIGLRIFCGTWNVNGKPPLVPVEEWLFPRTEGEDVDVYVIALQEVQGLSGTAALLTDEEKGRSWSAVLQQAVRAPSLFRCLAVRQMVGCYIMLLVRASLCADVSDVKVGELGTGFLNSGGNKGGVAVRFMYRGVSVCAISSHLAAQVSQVKRRNQDARELLSPPFDDYIMALLRLY